MLDVLRRNRVRTCGSGSDTLLFAHGFGCDQKLWRLVAPAFEATHRVALFDYVGSGGSDLSAYDERRYSSLEGYADDVVEVIEALGSPRVVFVGHSVSSMIGALAAARRPDLFRRLVMVCPSPSYLNEPPDYHGGFERADIEGLLSLMEKNPLGWAGFLAPVVMKNPERPELEGELRASFCAMDPRVARQFAAATFWSDNRADLARVSTPALVLQCTDDAIAPMEVGRFVQSRLQRGSLRVMRATGHCPHVSHPEETIEAIRDYLAGPAEGAD